MRRRIIGREYTVKGKHGTKVQIRLLAKFPVNLMHVA